jgi:hypothetical protein
MQHTAVLIAVALMHFIDIEGCNGLQLSPTSFYKRIKSHWKSKATPDWVTLESPSSPLLPAEGAHSQSPNVPISRSSESPESQLAAGVQEARGLEADGRPVHEDHRSKISEVEEKLAKLERELENKAAAFHVRKPVKMNLLNKYCSDFLKRDSDYDSWRRQARAEKFKIIDDLKLINSFITTSNVNERLNALFEKIADFEIEVHGGALYVIKGKLAKLEEELDKFRVDMPQMQDEQNRRNVLFAWLRTTRADDYNLIWDLEQLMKDISKTSSNANAHKIEEIAKVNASYNAFEKNFEDFEGEVFKKFRVF